MTSSPLQANPIVCTKLLPGLKMLLVTVMVVINENTTRLAIIFSYARCYVKPSFDFYKKHSKKIYESLIDWQKELRGYKFNPPLDYFSLIF